MFKNDWSEIYPLYVDNSLALNYLRIGKTKLAKEKLDACVIRAQIHGSKDFSRRAMSNLGRVCIIEKDYDKALGCFEAASTFVNEGEVGHLGILYYKIFCLILMESPKAINELAYARSISQENEEYSLFFTSLSHFLTLDSDLSVNHIEKVAIPDLMKKHSFHTITEYCDVMIDYFNANGYEPRALKFSVIRAMADNQRLHALDLIEGL